MPDIFKSWPQRDVMTPEEVVEHYANGFAGAKPSTPEETAEYEQAVQDSGGVLFGSVAGTAFTESHKGKLVAHFVHVQEFYPGCWPGPAQTRGDCVTQNDKNAKIYCHVCDILSGVPDAHTGVLEGVIDVSAEGIKQGLFATEVSYWFRGYNGDGWSCEAAAAVSMKSAGCVPRKNYPEIGIDLTRYSGATAGKWGKKPPPEEVRNAINKNLVHTTTRLRTFEEVRDFLGNGYGISSCGSEGFSSTRDENGVSSRRGSWSHAMAYIGVDDRPETHEKYGGPLVLVLNSWGKWNSGPRRVMGTDIDIPEGSFWARWKDIKNRSMIAYSGVNGWPARSLPDYSPGFQ